MKAGDVIEIRRYRLGAGRLTGEIVISKVTLTKVTPWRVWFRDEFGQRGLIDRVGYNGPLRPLEEPNTD